MLYKTRGIVFKSTKYSETSVISQIYTENFGWVAYIVNGVRSSKPKTTAGLLQPLSLLDLVVYHRENKNIQRISQIRYAHIYHSLPFDIFKRSISLFLIEILYKSIRQEQANTDLFEYIFNALQWLDKKEGTVANFHLLFMVHLTKYIGFFPYGKYKEHLTIFDLQEGIFAANKPIHEYFIEYPLSKHLSDLLEISFEDVAQLKLNRALRNALLEKLLLYYKLHIENLKDMKSPQILKAVMNN